MRYVGTGKPEEGQETVRYANSRADLAAPYSAINTVLAEWVERAKRLLGGKLVIFNMCNRPEAIELQFKEITIRGKIRARGILSDNACSRQSFA
jgi:hypothetical protein